MSFFIIPQAWITPAIMAGALHFGPVPGHVSIQYFAFKGNDQAAAAPPSTIWIDKRRKWDKRQVQCLMIHEYGHLKERPHSKNPRSIMAAPVSYKSCTRWLVRHNVR